MDIQTIRMANLRELIGKFSTQAEFADAVETAPAYVSQLLRSDADPDKKDKRSIGNDLARKIETRLKLPHGWLDVYHIERAAIDEQLRSVYFGRVPLKMWDDLFRKGAGQSMKDQAIAMIPTSADYGDRCFALQLSGDSMAPDFPDGSYIVIDPDLEFHPGNYVVAKTKDGQATFKQLVKDGTEFFLRPINPQFPINPLGDGEILGVVREVVSVKRLI